MSTEQQQQGTTGVSPVTITAPPIVGAAESEMAAAAEDILAIASGTNNGNNNNNNGDATDSVTGIPTEGVKLDTLEEGTAFDTEAFAKAERDFQQVLVDLVGDKSLEKFRTEYEKLHRALKKSHESEKRLIKRCRELNNEIVTNAAKVQTALRLSQEDQKTIAQLRKELDKAWAMIDLSHKKESQSKETIQKLKIEVANLTRLVEQGAGLSIGQEHSVKELLKIKEELTKERDELNAVVEAAKQEAQSMEAKLAAQEQEREAAEAQIKTLKTQLLAKGVDTEKEQVRRKLLEGQLKDLKQGLDNKQQELKQRVLQVQRSEAAAAALQHRLLEQTALAEKATKDKEVLDAKIVKLGTELEDERDRNEQLMADNKEKLEQIKQKEEMIKDYEVAEKRAAKKKKKLMDSIKEMEQSIATVEGSKEALKMQIEGLQHEIDGLKREQENERKKAEELQHDREMLDKKVEKATAESVKQDAAVKSGTAAKQHLEQEIDSLKEENQSQRKKIYSMEKEREKYVAKAQAADSTYQQKVLEVRLKEAAIEELNKKIAEQEGKLKQQKALYEQIRSERNVCSKKLVETQDENAEMQRKYKILTHQNEQLKEEIAIKKKAQEEEHLQLGQVLKLRDKYKSDLDRVRRQVEAAETTVEKHQKDIQELAGHTAELEEELLKQLKEKEIVGAEKDVLLQKITARNEEIEALKEKVAIHSAALTRGEEEYAQRVDDVKKLKTKIEENKRELETLRLAASQSDTLKTEGYQLQRELLAERAKVRALSDELENPMNIHRWRKLQGSDPSTFELIQKIQALQRRLIQKTEQLVERDSEIQEKQSKLSELEGTIGRHQQLIMSAAGTPISSVTSTPLNTPPATPGGGGGSREAVAQQLAMYKTTLGDKNRQLKSLQSELQTFQTQATEKSAEIGKLTEELNELKKKFYERKRKEQVTQQKQKMEQYQQLQLQQAEASQFRSTIGGGFNLKSSIAPPPVPPVPAASTVATTAQPQQQQQPQTKLNGSTSSVDQLTMEATAVGRIQLDDQ